jgi:putative sigma-54 modulation protein
MKIVSTFKNLEHTEALDERIEEKSQRLNKFFEGNFDVLWTCYIREDGQHCADIKVVGPAFEYHAGAFAENLYKTLDLAIGKIERQVHKKKTKWKSNISQKHKLGVKDQQIAQAQWDENYWEEKEAEEVAS